MATQIACATARRQRGTFALMAVVFLLAVVAYAVRLGLDESQTTTYDAMLASQDLQALLLADAATERAVAQLRMAFPSPTNGLMRSEDCALFASGSYSLGAGSYSYLSATTYPAGCSTTSASLGCQSCFITVEGNAGAAKRTVALNVAYDKGDGVTGSGTSIKLKLSLPSSPSLALMNMAWRVQMKKGSTSDIAIATATTGTQLWNIPMPNSNPLLGSLGSYLYANAGDYTLQDSLSTVRTYAAVAAIIDQNCGAPVYTFDSDTQSWTAAGNSTLTWVSGGYARLSVGTGTPHGMNSPATSFSGYKCDTVTVKLRRPNVSTAGWYGALQWTTAAAPQFGAANMVRVAQPASWGTTGSPTTHTLVFVLSGETNWTQQTITGIRFVPGTIPVAGATPAHTFEIDSIEIKPFSSTTSIAESVFAPNPVSNNPPRTSGTTTIGLAGGSKDRVSNGLTAGWCPVDSNVIAFAYSEYSAGATLPATAGAQILLGNTADSGTYALPAGNLQLKRVTGRLSYDGTLGSEIYTGSAPQWSISPVYAAAGSTTIYVPGGVLNQTVPAQETTRFQTGDPVQISQGTGAFPANTYVSSIGAKSFVVSEAPTTQLGYMVTVGSIAGNVITVSSADAAKVNVNDRIAVGGTGASGAGSASAAFPAGTYVMWKPSTTTFVVSNRPTGTLSANDTLIGSGYAASAAMAANPYQFIGNSTSSTTTVTASTADVAAVNVGDRVVVQTGTGSFASGTYVIAKPSSTTFTVSATPSVALSGTNRITSTPALGPYLFTAASTSSATTVTASATDVARVNVGDVVAVQSGTGSFANGTYVTAKPTSTTFTVSQTPGTALSAAVIVAGGAPGGGTTASSALWMYFNSGNTPYKLVSSTALAAPDDWVGGFACFKGVYYCEQGVTKNADGSDKSCNVPGLAVRPDTWLQDF